MFVVDIPRIPPEGLDLDEELRTEALHVEGEEDFVLASGGRLRCHVEIVDQTTVHVRGSLEARVDAECGRCLARYAVALDTKLDQFYLPRLADRPEEQEEEVELGDHDVVVGYYDGEQLDLGEVAREQIFLALPLKRLCREDCAGLCPACGKNRNEGACACPAAAEPVDSRLEPLRRLVDPDRN
jgi:uncharacterized protein